MKIEIETFQDRRGGEVEATVAGNPHHLAWEEVSMGQESFLALTGEGDEMRYVRTINPLGPAAPEAATLYAPVAIPAPQPERTPERTRTLLARLRAAFSFGAEY